MKNLIKSKLKAVDAIFRSQFKRTLFVALPEGGYIIVHTDGTTQVKRTERQRRGVIL